MHKKIIASLLFVMIVSTGLALPVRAKAFSILGIVGVVDIVIDPAHIAKTILKGLEAAKRFALDNIFKVVIARLKKRLLDALVDATVRWIQGDGDPRFITNPDDFFEDALQAAIGDTVQAIGLGDLCYPDKNSGFNYSLLNPYSLNG